MHGQIFDNLPNDSKNKIYIFIILDKSFNVMSGGKRLENILLHASPAYFIVSALKISGHYKDRQLL